MTVTVTQACGVYVTWPRGEWALELIPCPRREGHDGAHARPPYDGDNVFGEQMFEGPDDARQ